MPKTFPFDTYSRIITYKCRNLSTKKVKEQLRSRVSESTIYRCFKRYQLLGVIKPNCNKGLKYRTRKFNTSALESLQALFAEVETLYLDEAAAILTNVLGVCVNPCGVSRACKELGLSRKKLTTRFREANISHQNQFIRYVRGSHFRLDQFIWLDESAVNHRNFLRPWGRAQRGVRTKSTTPRSKGPRHSVLPIVTASGVRDWYIVPGSINIERMKDFIQRCLVRREY
ncbi:hypothetical protein CHLRE_10g447225v5 [Chlamydomonas reinhardtii]|uniref:Transposase n=1 Tax=Chlamydomonas reinhardtii TaxID=3055 RepID=A0A2K3DAX7_CHLRE|nr:uncharacterized protein CHLRE_10g447225v5 [Chlamydomonas reinhardtii]PNW77684.1 hypothetical protein CHLRE_10g447225v5 [Chlamydomonas reinhardtii]